MLERAPFLSPRLLSLSLLLFSLSLPVPFTRVFPCTASITTTFACPKMLTVATSRSPLELCLTPGQASEAKLASRAPPLRTRVTGLSLPSATVHAWKHDDNGRHDSNSICAKNKEEKDDTEKDNTEKKKGAQGNQSISFQSNTSIHLTPHIHDSFR